ncbi:MAG: hypothetical protein ABI674_11555 [Spartobacteria bacterium]
MATLRVIRAVAIGAAAVAVPTLALAAISQFVISRLSLGPLVASLCTNLVLVGGMAWVCLRIAHFPRALAALLTTLPFVLLATLLIYTRSGGLTLFGVVLLLLACFFAWAGSGIATGRILVSTKRLFYLAIGVAGFILSWNLTVRFTAIPVHAFDHSWDVHHEIPIDTRITRMAKRAQFDSYVSGLPVIGRGKLRLESAARHGSDYDLFFLPTWASDTLVVYRFRLDGKPLWKTCNWAET